MVRLRRSEALCDSTEHPDCRILAELPTNGLRIANRHLNARSYSFARLLSLTIPLLHLPLYVQCNNTSLRQNTTTKPINTILEELRDTTSMVTKQPLFKTPISTPPPTPPPSPHPYNLTPLPTQTIFSFQLTSLINHPPTMPADFMIAAVWITLILTIVETFRIAKSLDVTPTMALVHHDNHRATITAARTVQHHRHQRPVPVPKWMRARTGGISHHVPMQRAAIGGASERVGLDACGS